MQVRGQKKLIANAKGEEEPKMREHARKNYRKTPGHLPASVDAEPMRGPQKC
jgi:hypothetical protein